MSVEERLDALEESMAEVEAAIAQNEPAELGGALQDLAQQQSQQLRRTAAGAVVLSGDVARARAQGIL